MQEETDPKHPKEVGNNRNFSGNKKGNLSTFNEKKELDPTQVFHDIGLCQDLRYWYDVQ